MKTAALKTAAQSIGLASLLLLENYTDLLGGAGTARTHVPFSIANICLASVLDILIVGLIVFSAVSLLTRVPVLYRRAWPAARFLIVCLVPLYFLSREQSLLPFALPEAFVLSLYILWPIILLALLWRFRALYAQAIQLAGVLGVAAGIFAIASIAQMLWLTRWKPGPQSQTAAWATSPQPPRQHPLIVWIVFDELSYDQLYQHRAPGLQLPAFDSLRAQSTVYPGAQPIGDRTAKILPSLIGGRIVDDLRFSASNQLDLHYENTRGWHPVLPAESVFADARYLGWRTAAVGWYNPYCTAYAGAIDDCYWSDYDSFEGPMSPDPSESLLANTTAPLTQLGLRLVSPASAADSICDYDVRTRLQSFLDLEKHSLNLLRNDQADFVFLHLPVPHSPSIWRRETNSYTDSCGGSYLDNLALADHELGKVLAILQASPRWPRTALIVQGDHSWRTAIWDGLSAWTPEDGKASGGRFDPRPALIIHQPTQTTPAANPAAVSLLPVSLLTVSLLTVHETLEQLLHQPPPAASQPPNSTHRCCASVGPKSSGTPTPEGMATQ